ncbi:methyltransferase [uncultured Draconibacterium sp.]|uniref:tRNA1(Val) (adenine(37)-N6)-methyltransferase n=1 Tax=uncultured Draconibacterium sp. TaxID=1573823 RepID=UPI0032174977
MAGNNYFQFKQFTVQQENSAMKVGTDGVLLGSWVNVESCSRILDVGTGTGLIALMLAQRSEARITAIEIEVNAATEACNNVANSHWNKQIDVKNSSYQDFAKSSEFQFDLIVSNPPFFQDDLKAFSQERNLARHNDSLPFSDLVFYSVKRLSNSGRLAVILPLEQARVLEKLAREHDLFLIRKTDVKPNPKKEVNRVLMEFGKIEAALVYDCLSVYSLNRSEYSDEFIQLTKDFYLRF